MRIYDIKPQFSYHYNVNKRTREGILNNMNFLFSFVQVLLCVIAIVAALPVIKSSQSENLLKDAFDNRNWISNYNDDLITVNEDHHVKNETDDVSEPTSSLQHVALAAKVATAALGHTGRGPLWLTNQRPVRQQVKAAAVPFPAAQPIELVLVSVPNPATYQGHSAAVPPVTKFNNESLKLNKLKATDTVHDDVNGNGSREAGPLQQDYLATNSKDNVKAFHTDDIEENNSEGKKQQKLQQPQPTNQQHLKFYTPNTLEPLSFGQLPQFQQQQQQQKENVQQLSLSTPLPQVHLDNNNNHHHQQQHQIQMADYRLFYNAERNTDFYLYTLIKTGRQMMPYTKLFKTSPQDASYTPNKSKSSTTTTTTTNNASTHGRVLHVVSDTISAAFGVNTHPVAGIQGIRIEVLELYNARSLRQSRYNPFNPTRILIHGWLGGSSAGIYNTLVPEFLKLQQGTYNVITVDWGKGAIADYITASYRVKPVGKVVAKFIDFLHRESGTEFENIHVVGFSMGAHVAGIAGKYVQTGRLPVIYALDPALPLFRYDHIKERLDKTDADYVEVIHSSAGSYGYDRPLGHVDFYVNYGSNQPGCYLNECSHFRGFQIFAQSLSSEELQGIKCSHDMWQGMIKLNRCGEEIGDYLKMNVEGLNKTARLARSGIYYLLTNSQPPYKL